jgi:hypothetical protein
MIFKAGRLGDDVLDCDCDRDREPDRERDCARECRDFLDLYCLLSPESGS